MKIVIFLCLLPLSLGASRDIYNCAAFCLRSAPDTNETVRVSMPYCYAFRHKCLFDVIQCLLGPQLAHYVRIVSHEECKEFCNTNCSDLVNTDVDDSLKQKCKVCRTEEVNW